MRPFRGSCPFNCFKGVTSLKIWLSTVLLKSIVFCNTVFCYFYPMKLFMLKNTLICYLLLFTSSSYAQSDDSIVFSYLCLIHKSSSKGKISFIPEGSKSKVSLINGRQIKGRLYFIDDSTLLIASSVAPFDTVSLNQIRRIQTPGGTQSVFSALSLSAGAVLILNGNQTIRKDQEGNDTRSGLTQMMTGCLLLINGAVLSYHPSYLLAYYKPFLIQSKSKIRNKRSMIKLLKEKGITL